MRKLLFLLLLVAGIACGDAIAGPCNPVIVMRGLCVFRVPFTDSVGYHQPIDMAPCGAAERDSLIRLGWLPQAYPDTTYPCHRPRFPL